jgi:long-chain acyl-CoA synthetase
LLTLDEWTALVTEENPSLICHKQSRDELATIVYTSGTTGRPKGVMLSHNNILSNAYSGGAKAIEVYTSDVFLSFLPLSHMLERTAGYYIPIMFGSTLAFARSVQDLAEDLLTIRPTVLISVPRIYERVYNKIYAQLDEKSAIARGLFLRAVEAGWSRFSTGQSPISWQVLKPLVANKVLAKLGGRLRIAICGGAPLSPTVAKTFIGLGLNLLQGYGLTETSPIIAVNRTEDNIPASVGLPLDGIEVKLGEHDELLVRGPCNMLGYWHNAEATRQMIDTDGWLHTGDKAKIEQGHIFITGRIKEILVLSNGEKVPPSDMEMAITMDNLFEQALVLGEGRPYLSALLVLSSDNCRLLSQQLDRDITEFSEINNPELKELLLQRVNDLTSKFPGYAQIKQIYVCSDPWSVENGLMTPTLKLKRHSIMEKYASEVSKLYEGH